MRFALPLKLIRKQIMKPQIIKLPRFLLSAVTVAAVLYLTLAPRPFGGLKIPLFPGADKVIHAVMFIAVAFSFCLDFGRNWKRKKIVLLSACFLAATALGGLIEVVQSAMAMGRSGDWFDLLADAIGAFVGVCIGGFVLEKSKQ